MGFEPICWDLSLDAGLWGLRLGFEPWGWDLSLEVVIWALRLGFEPQGWNFSLEVEIWASRLGYGHPTPIHTQTLTHKHKQKVSKMRIFPLSDSIITDQWTDWWMDGLSDQRTKPLIELHVCTKNNNRSMSYFGPWSCMDDCKCKWEYAGQQSPSGWSPMMRWAHE